MSARLANLQESVEQMDSELGEFKENMGDNDAELKNLLASKDSEFRQLHIELGDRQRDIQAVSAKFKKHTDLLNNQKAKLTAAEKDLQLLKTQLDQQREQIVEDPEQLKRAHQTASATVDEAQQRLSEAESVRAIQMEMERLSGQVRKFVERLKSNQSSLDNVLEEYNTLRDRLEGLDNEESEWFKEHRRKEATLRNQIGMVKTNLEMAQQRKEAMELANASCQQREREQQQKIEEYKNMTKRELLLIKEADVQSNVELRDFSQLRTVCQETLAMYSQASVNLHSLKKSLTPEYFNALNDVQAEVNEFKAALINLAKTATAPSQENL
eukprot:Protomagalhaensia_wolfi_Nauph_80__6280@NODE_963_length_1850_cov_9_998896_g728_i0_p1_GENE_NODE_963_length_1850_cov_9_998896_g728_i0NODE_963_length_1850_cov_9_998896_g728_i0_p1_ORF_typecomplete_len327_score73_52WEMBL/PF05701_11/0_0094WEMBL/PF05701_11/0_0043MAD/PF05557_13/9_6e05AAA_13/PF13166_6/0_019AAA_13/PF13166_6/0_019AAA_13/PF13166_6/81RmuC/PF02646_16/13RmuC/PF02646_16/2_4e02RmuC/PF02646_16/0_0037RmuC/PF02646_16/3_9e03DUF3584/PF12128_8/0_035DUF3584/PF12128_8/0_37UPF0242/PF06785_11/0_013UPF0242/